MLYTLAPQPAFCYPVSVLGAFSYVNLPIFSMYLAKNVYRFLSQRKNGTFL